jgi:hypothetical protein
MKLSFAILTFLILCSCENSTKINTVKNIDGENILNTQNDDTNKIRKELIGEWGIYVLISDGIELNCNVCPRIKFEEQNNATITLPSGDIENYTWSLTTENLTLQTIDTESSENFLQNAIYKLNLIEEKEFTELILSLNKTEQVILRK